ncbi:MAG TPA: RNA-binding cell elongation regulator Jag/EloR [Acidimicrobiales bacterium]|nr:RNA-binding cell elongation regulator Jag/EloR [Acidimicrobiales bacterium]
MEWVETTGRDVASALATALDELGVDEQDAEFVILEQARPGFLGLGRTEARVRARVRPSAPRPKRPQRGRRERSGRSSSAERSAPTRPDGPARQQRGGGRRGAQQRPSSSDAPAEVEETARASVDDGGSADAADGTTTRPAGAPRKRRGGRGRGTAERAPVERGSGAPEEEEDQMSVDQQAEIAGAFVRGVVERFGLDAATDVLVSEEHISVEVTGEDLGLLVGPRGATLDALQELTRTVVQRRGEEHGTRIVVDVAGFRARRAAALEAFTRRVADEVLASGSAEALEPMSAADRKIVHDVVNSIDGVETTSEGTDPRRYVVVRPAGSVDADR